jgi:hypothetical protein
MNKESAALANAMAAGKAGAGLWATIKAYFAIGGNRSGLSRQ